MNVGKTVYLNWYDFDKKTEHVCKGQVVDNALWADTQWSNHINVSFQPPHAAGPFCHHFPEDKLSLTPDDVPHDDCYLLCGRKTRAYQHDVTIKKVSPSDAWQQVQQFKHDHWDYEHGHLSTDALAAFYQLWHDAIAVKRGLTVTQPVTQPVVSSVASVANAAPITSPAGNKLTKKQKHSTGAIQYTDSIQTSLFD